MATSAAEVIVKVLAASGVKRVYGLPGDSLNAFTEAIRRHTEIEWVHVRHEEAAAFAAGGEAHLTGHLAVCAGSCGPGNLHLINGLYDCHRSRVPVLALAAQIPSAEIGSGYFQETHPEELFRECSYYCELVSASQQVPRILAIAMRNAISLRGVAVVVVPGDVLAGDCSAEGNVLHLGAPASSMLPPSVDLELAAQLLNQAEKVTILGGIGCEGAQTELLAAAEALKAPIVHSLRGKECIEGNNPYDVGMTGLLGMTSGYHAMMDCDALLVLGCDLPYQQFYPTKAKIIQVDLRGEQIGRRAKVDVGLTGTVKDTLLGLTPRLRGRSDRKHLDTALDRYAKVRKELEDLAENKPGHIPIHPQYVARLVDELASDDAIFLADVGTPTIWAARHLTMNGQRRLLGSFVHGSMAGAVPQGIGAQAAYPGRQVITFSGDGGLAMLMGDLLTLIQMQLPVKIICFNNSALSFVELEMKAAGLLNFGTDLHNPSFAKVAEACGLLGVRVELPEDLRDALKQALTHDGPALVDVVVNRQELSMPPHIAVSQAAGFGLWAAKAMLNHEGNQIIDMTKSNLFR